MALCDAVQVVLGEQPSEFEFRDGLVYVTNERGVRAVRLRTFYASFHNAAKCMQECHAARDAEVVQFPGAASGH